MAVVDLIQWLVIPAAFALDALVGDPRSWPHPIRWMGRCIEIYEPICRRWFVHEYLAGTIFAVTLVFLWWTGTMMVTRAAYWIHPGVGFGWEVVVVFFCLSTRSLSDAGMEIYRLLSRGRLDEARSALSMIVGRDVATYGEADISRATVETVAENFVDGVLSPLFFAAIGGAPMAVAFKMVNTLDSMVGYKNDRYRRFGWASARIDDAANFIPARLSVPIISLACALLDPDKGRRSLRTAVAEGARHTSPNAGYPEAAFAGALAVRLNGPDFYGGILVQKPYIGAAFGRVDADHIKKACGLLMISAIVSTALFWMVSIGLKAL